MSTLSTLLALTTPLLLSGCTGTGTWVVETWGEDYIEDQIPAADVDDGYAITYDEFLIVLGPVALIDGNGDEVAGLGDPQVFDMTQAGPHAVGDAGVPSTHYDQVDMTVAPASGAVAGNATEDQVTRMNDDGLSVSVAGSASLGNDSFTFAWDFTTDTHYACEPDLTIADGGEGSTQLTIHGDHLFYDDLEDPEAVVTFGVLAAADADADGEVTRAELEAVDVATTGHGVGQYSDVTNLWLYVEHLTQTLGHIDGEGHCQVSF
jgi:hypothetical protein